MRNIIVFFMLLFPLSGFAQLANNDTTLKINLVKFASINDSLTKTRSAEKLYLQLDKPYYATGDTIWFKAYLFSSPTLLLSSRSGLMYIDIEDEGGKTVKQYLMPIKNGISWGNIGLDSSLFKTGTYTLRAYTNWMHNFGEAGFYYKQFYVASPGENNWLITSQASTNNDNGKYHVNSKLQFTDLNKVPFANKLLDLKIYSGTKNLYKQNLQTDANGLLDVNFTLPTKSDNLVIIAESGDQKAIIPININRADKVDIQFLPEGGSILADLPANIAFKAIGENGKGINIAGIITDQNQQQVATFQSIHNGMGSFRMAIKSNESYTARITLPNGTVKDYPLPSIKNTGTLLQIKIAMETDSVEVSVAATNDIVKTGSSYFLIGKSRGIICYAAIVDFHNNNYIRSKIAKRLFPTGITHFILTTTGGQPINERLAYIDHNDNLNISITPNKPGYAERDSIGLSLKITDAQGNPVAGNFSMAVTDDAQVTTDSLKEDNILTHTFLTSDLKGYVEEPVYYFQKQNAITWQALDNLLLTQGWVNYDWQTTKDQPAYAAEDQFAIKGHVFNGFNGSIKNTHVELLSKSPVFVRDTITDKGGKFAFYNFPRIDTPAFILKAVNKNGKSFNVGIKMDEIPPPVFAQAYPASAPWYVNSDAAIINYTKNRDSINNQKDYYQSGGHHLNEVKILAKKTVNDSQNLNGPGNADLVLDEKDMEKAGKKTWLQLFEENIKGFKTGIAKGTQFILQDKSKGDIMAAVTNSNVGPFMWYFVEDKPIIFIVDGVNLMVCFRDASDLGSPNINDLTKYFQLHNAEDIKGIELNWSTEYGSSYLNRYIQPEYRPYVSAFSFSFVEITTRSGRGPIIDNTPGMYLYKPLALSWPKQFYKPKYTVNDTTKHLPDMRSTIDWEPNIISDKDGTASVYFYSSDRPGTYTVTVEGTDMNGNLGSATQKIIIDGKKNKSKSK